ncbi:nuclear transport factor 2 family protein [Maribacter sp. 2-571]|uniref:nuclear transport factor 2 family protein n=1 Tax=Maribacter sp. 2-571 TaxID=3417569 RepID=UPI003D32A359
MDISKKTEFDEISNIIGTLNIYSKGAKAGDSRVMQKAFHPLAQIYGQLENERFEHPIKTLFDYVDEHEPSQDLQFIIRSIDKSGEGASARVEISNWHGHMFTDFFTLLKIDDRWLITNKIFITH